MSSQPGSSDRLTGTKETQNVQHLLSKIELALEDGDFEAAENLRNSLIEAAPLAIGEAIKAAEMIEKEMSAAICKDHLAIWPELYERLTTGERNCLFHSTKLYVLPEKRMLLKYGSLNNRLFFLEKGRVTIAVPQGENKFKIVAELGPGDILGEYSFSTIALCSASAVTKTAVQIRCLDGKTAEAWEEKHPGLYEKLLDFCRKYGKVDVISERKEQQGHTYPRHAVDGQVKAVLLDRNGHQTEIIFNGEVKEISRSGTSFSIHCKKRAIVKQLLTRSFSLLFTCRNKGQKLNFAAIGKVVHVTFLLYDDYLLHVGFHSPLPEKVDVLLAS